MAGPHSSYQGPAADGASHRPSNAAPGTGLSGEHPLPAKRMVPDRFRTQLCRHFALGGACGYGEFCFFAHGSHELRTREANRAVGLTSRPLRARKDTLGAAHDAALVADGVSGTHSPAATLVSSAVVTVGNRVVAYCARPNPATSQDGLAPVAAAPSPQLERQLTAPRPAQHNPYAATPRRAGLPK